MTGLHRALVAIALAGLVSGAASVAVIADSDHVPQRGATIAIGLLIGWSFIGTGLFAWWRRPASRFGPMMAGVGFLSLLGSATAANQPVVFTVGVLRPTSSSCCSRTWCWRIRTTGWSGAGTSA